jgi:hypothetical protein
MEFINFGVPVKIRIGEPSECYWATIRTGEVVDLTREAGLSYGFSVKTTEGQIGSKKVETKQIVTKESILDFCDELKSIKGIGKKTAEDIAAIYTKESLIEMIKLGKRIPVRDDIEKLLREQYE